MRRVLPLKRRAGSPHASEQADEGPRWSDSGGPGMMWLFRSGNGARVLSAGGTSVWPVGASEDASRPFVESFSPRDMYISALAGLCQMFVVPSGAVGRDSLHSMLMKQWERSRFVEMGIDDGKKKLCQTPLRSRSAAVGSKQTVL